MSHHDSRPFSESLALHMSYALFTVCVKRVAVMVTRKEASLS